MSEKEIAAAAEVEEEEELVDPYEKLRDECRATTKCAAALDKLNSCNDRVNSKAKTSEICVEEVIDYFHCVDHCAAKNLFKHLK